jgi:hypothetical protein
LPKALDSCGAEGTRGADRDANDADEAFESTDAVEESFPVSSDNELAFPKPKNAL